ncbi:YeiH family protein [Paenibacillus alkalitolerans]|uniref:YeiH family protein n=1 Tax=Paenibacillus alkalitolerans TaxID=2799335 RepID=UPI0018F6B871|nr:YeiH family protein [Paenibacillus alkalitolerans]
MDKSYGLTLRKKKGFATAKGIALTVLLAAMSNVIGVLPPLGVIGPLVIAIILGIAWRALFGVPSQAFDGVAAANQKMLRLGIVLLGMRLNLGDIAAAGPKVLALAGLNIVFAVFAVYALARLLRVDKKLGMLTACGTAICGAAAVAAISPQIKANANETAISAATVAVLGTLFTIMYTLTYRFLGFTPYGYGVFSGATLHEIAHVVAAAAPGGKAAVDIAVVVKLTRVALLVPVALGIEFWRRRSFRTEHSGTAGTESRSSIPFPWFIVGFLAMSALNTAGVITPAVANQVVSAAYFLMAIGMVGLGLNVDMRVFFRAGMKAFAAGLAGSVLLSAFGYVLVHGFGLLG